MESFDIAKVTQAVYKILDYLPENDPLKNKAKEKVLAILEQITLLRQPEVWVSVKALLSEGRQQAILQLLADIEILQGYLNIGRGQGWIDSLNYLIISKEYGLMQAWLQSFYQVKRLDTVPQIPSPSKIVVETKNSEVSLLYTVRQQKILTILQQRPKTQVGDLIKQLPSVTKRTIRRDLDELLKKGEIVRVGQWNQVFYQVK